MTAGRESAPMPNKSRHPAPTPGTPRTCPRAAALLECVGEGGTPRPGAAGGGGVAGKGARPLPAYDGSSYTTTAERGEHVKRRTHSAHPSFPELRPTDCGSFRRTGTCAERACEVGKGDERPTWLTGRTTAHAGRVAGTACIEARISTTSRVRPLNNSTSRACERGLNERAALRMCGPLFSFRIDSCLRLMGGRWGLVWLGFCKLRPDFAPVGPQSHSGHYPPALALNRHTGFFTHQIAGCQQLAQVSNRGAAALGKAILLGDRQPVEVCT